MNSRIDTPMDAFRMWMDAGSGEPLRKTMFHQMERFWEGQRRMLDEYESFSRAMLERRRNATVSTLETLRKMGSASDGTEWAKCCSDWLTGSFTRVAEDSRDMIQESWKMFAEVSQSMTQGMAETAQATSETQQAAARGVSQTAAAAQAAAEQGAASAQEAARLAAARAGQRPKRPEEGARA